MFEEFDRIINDFYEAADEFIELHRAILEENETTLYKRLKSRGIKQMKMI